MCELGCYEGVCESSGNLRKFIAESIHGGRVSSRENKMWDVKADIKIIDGKSLYPSAIKAICEELGGFPLGICKQITNWSLRNTFTHFIVKIKITKINKIQQLPFITYYSDGGRNYTNDPPPNSVTVDKITLEDWEEFHGIEYDYIEGVYWSVGSNPIAGKHIQELYDVRNAYTNEGNSGMSQLCKLCLNSLYGKTIIKPNTVKTVIKDNDKVDTYILKNFSKLIDMEQCHNQSIFTIKQEDDKHANLGHVGGMILSMARRIMNRVLNLANTWRIPILYQDTDSMHVVDSSGIGLAGLIDKYREVYGKELIGKQLGQFAEELCFNVPATNIHSTRQLILGKKVYLHCVTGTSLTGETLYKNHYRIKAINSHALDEYPDTRDLYQRMYNGEEIAFDLTYGDGCIMNYAGSASVRDSYIKKLSFTGEKGTEQDLVEWVSC
jgi:hypothetical protein